MRFAPADRARRGRAGIAAGTVLLAVALAGCSDRYVAPPAPSATSADVAQVESAAAGTVDALQVALSGSDQQAAGALASEEGSAEVLRAAVGNVDAIGLRDIALRYVGRSSGRPGTDPWVARVDVSWRIAGFDRSVAQREVLIELSADGTEVLSLAAGESAAPTWLTGQVEVRRSADALVIARSTSTARLDDLAQMANRAVSQVRDVVGGEPRVVFEVPSDTRHLDRALGEQAGTYAAVAGVTASTDGSLAPDAPVHVFLNPSVFFGLDPTAAQVVMTHEAVHAATGAFQAGGAPLWLVEGFADYVALRDVDLPVERIAAQIIDEVRRNGVPEELPSDADFNLSAHGLGAQYEAAWLACLVIADQGGERTLSRLYQDAMGGADAEASLRRLSAWGTTDLTRAWQRRLGALAERAELKPN